jgi:hypothetical protein
MRTTTAIVFTIAFFAFAFLFLQMAILWDADSYYHLAVARHYASHGLFAPIPWARLSLLSNGADKELLFHIALIPFATLVDPATGGRIALALLNAALFAVIGNLCARKLGAIGFAVPLVLWIAAPPFFARAARLRPELVALLIILIAIPFAARQLWIAVGVLAMLFAYSYTAFHVFLFICVIWFFTNRLNLAGPIAGTLIALFLRPHPIANLHLWFVQNVAFFFDKSRLDVGNEILPPSLLRIAVASLGWLLFLALTCRSKALRNPLAIAAAVPAVVFTILFIGIARMAAYFFPLATIALVLLFGLRSRLVPIAIAAGTLIGIPMSMNPTLLRILGGGRISEADWEAFGKHVPRDAKVAATWGDAEIYALWAPQGRYLNVLDPIFMARPHPREYAIQRAIFDGSHPDIAGAAKRDLDSDFVALDWTSAPPVLIERIKSDPRLRVRYGGYNVLLEIVPSDVKFVSAPAAGCTTFDRVEEGPRRFAFAPYGAGAVAIDGKVIASNNGTLAILSRAVNVDVPAGSHRLAIRTCGARGFNGYFAVYFAVYPERSEGSAEAQRPTPTSSPRLH